MRTDEQWAALITSAHAEGRVLTAPVDPEAISQERAYVIQDHVTGYRLARGEQVAGWKLGYTSAAMRTQMGIASPNFGPLTDAMVMSSPGVLLGEVTHPRVEPEIALVIGEDGRHAGAAHAALEVVDSVWADYSFSWADNTADGSSAAYVVVGPELPLQDLDRVEVEMSVDGQVVARGLGSAAMGDPLAALDWLHAQLSGHPRGLCAGDLVITGGLTSAHPLESGSTVRASFAGTVVEVTREP